MLRAARTRACGTCRSTPRSPLNRWPLRPMILLSLQRFLGSNFPGLGIPTLIIKIMLESNPLKSRILVRRLAVAPTCTCRANALRYASSATLPERRATRHQIRCLRCLQIRCLQIRVYRSGYTSRCICVCVCVCMYVCMYVCIYIYIYVCLSLSLSIYIYTYVCMYVCMYIYIYIYIYMYVHIHIYIYIYIHTHVYKSGSPKRRPSEQGSSRV